MTRRIGAFVLRLPLAVAVLYLGLLTAYAVGAGYGYRIGLVVPTPLNFVAFTALVTFTMVLAATVVRGRWSGPKQSHSAAGVLTVTGAVLAVWVVAGSVLVRFV